MDGVEVMYSQSELFPFSGDIIHPTQVEQFLSTLNEVNELYSLVTEGMTTGPSSVEKFGEEWKIGSDYSDVVHRRLGYISGSTRRPGDSTLTIHLDEPVYNPEGRLIYSTTELYRNLDRPLGEATLLTFESRSCSTSIARFKPEKWLSRVAFSRFVGDPHAKDDRSVFRLFLDESMTRIGTYQIHRRSWGKGVWREGPTDEMSLTLLQDEFNETLRMLNPFAELRNKTVD